MLFWIVDLIVRDFIEYCMDIFIIYYICLSKLITFGREESIYDGDLSKNSALDIRTGLDFSMH